MMKSTLFLTFVPLSTTLWIGCRKTQDILEDYSAIYRVTDIWVEHSTSQIKSTLSSHKEKSTIEDSLLLFNIFSYYNGGYTFEAIYIENILTIPMQAIFQSSSICGAGTLSCITFSLSYTDSLSGISTTIQAFAVKQ
ncbi:MAG: hypothetical protein WCP08_10885 [Prolixibacteraceae bacterium]